MNNNRCNWCKHYVACGEGFGKCKGDPNRYVDAYQLACNEYEEN